jgi:hypothetical protein
LQQQLFAFEIPKIKHRGNWGNAWSTWSKEAPQPNIELCLYSKTAGKLNISVMAGDLKLNSWELPITAGLNYPEYHGEVLESAVAAFSKQLNEKKKKEEKAVEVKKAKNGKYYLLKGEYKISFEMNGQKITEKLNIE